jgi:hypothetical protein
MDETIKTYTSAELEKLDTGEYEARMREPIDLYEKLIRPRSDCMGGAWDEFNERDLCAAFAADVNQWIRSTIPGRGIALTKESLSALPHHHAVYWLNCPLDSNFNAWRTVYVGKAQNLRHRWYEDEHHRLEQARKYGCRLDWWEVEPGTECLLEAALIYQWKPAWNMRD